MTSTADKVYDLLPTQHPKLAYSHSTDAVLLETPTMSSQIKVRKIAEYTGHRGPIYSLILSNRKNRFLSCSSEGIVAEWSLEERDSGSAVAVARSPGPIFSMYLSPERGLLVLGLGSGDIIFTDIKERKTLRRVQLHKKAIFDFLPLPDGKTILASGGDGAISLWNLDQLGHFHFQKICSSSIRTMAIHPSGKSILVGSSDNKIRIFDMGLELKQEWIAHKLSVFRLAFSSDGKYLLSTGRGAHLTSWDVNNDYKMLHSVPAHLYAVNDIVFSDDPEIVFSGSMDSSIKMWRTYDLKLMKVCNFEKNQCHRNGINRLLWMSGGLISVGDDRKIMRWQFERV